MVCADESNGTESLGSRLCSFPTRKAKNTTEDSSSLKDRLIIQGQFGKMSANMRSVNIYRIVTILIEIVMIMITSTKYKNTNTKKNNNFSDKKT